MPFIELRREAWKKRRSRKRVRTAGVLVAVITLLGGLGYETLRFTSAMAQWPPVVWRKPWGGIERYEPAPVYRAARAVYPYSVVPGGVQNETEVAASMAKDPVVARHYRDVLPERLHTIRLNAAVNVYASYRTGNSVHWTSHTIPVAKGELVLTDGGNLIRARCGNRLSFTPPRTDQPSSSTPDAKIPPIPAIPPVEPPEPVLEHGMPPILASPVLTSAGSPAPPLLEETTGSQVAHFWPPAALPPEWCCGPGGFPGNWHPAHPNRPGRPKPPTPGVPEPTTSLLIGTGVFVMLIRMARQPKR